MKKYEYKITTHLNLKDLNKEGKEGWELCTILKESLNPQAQIYWKRKISLFKILAQIKEYIYFIRLK